jgi:hypothetical protein
MATTEYTAQDLTRIARAAVKGIGTYRRWRIAVRSVPVNRPLTNVSLVVFYLPKGWPKGDGSDHISVAI